MKRKFLNLIPECYVDTNLIEYLAEGAVNHQHSCNKVVGLLNTTFKDGFAIGIIDRDRVQTNGYLNDCYTIASTEHLTLLKHKTRHQYLITVCPAADGFILDCAIREGIRTEDFGLPSRLKDFIKISKAVTSNSDVRFRNLFKALRDNREFRNLRISLGYLLENSYKTDPDALKALFEAPSRP